jgi:hypothetical protein
MVRASSGSLSNPRSSSSCPAYSIVGLLPTPQARGSEDRLLHRPVDRGTQPRIAGTSRIVQHREDPHRRLLDMLRQVLGPQTRPPAQPGRCGRRGSQDLLPPMAVRLGPALPTPPGHLLLDHRIGDHDRALRLPVAAGRAAHRGIEGGPHDIIGNPLSRQLAERRGGVQRGEDQQNLGFGNGHGGSCRSSGRREAQGLDRGFCVVQLRASANLRSISVRQLSMTLIACSSRVQPSPFAGSILAIGMRRAAVSSSPSGQAR